MVIANPATRVSARAVARVLTQVVPPGVRMDLRWTPGPGTAKALADEALDHADAIIAVGGDGTVSEVASAMLGSGLPLGILPGGSTNIIAQEHGVPNELEGAARLIFRSHRLVTIDAATCNRRSFLHMAGAGVDSLLFELADADLKRMVGWMAYLPAAVQALMVPPATYTLAADDERLVATSPLVLIANGSSIIRPELRLASSIRADDGWLDLMVVTAKTPPELASVIARLVTLRFDSSPLVIHRRVRSVRIEASRPMSMQLDGDVVGQTPAEIEILPKAIDLIVPA